MTGNAINAKSEALELHELSSEELEAVSGGGDKVKSTRGAEEVQHSEFSIVKLVDAATP